MKEHTGYVYDCGHKWYARFDYTDELGKRRTIRRKAPTEAKGETVIGMLA